MSRIGFSINKKSCKDIDYNSLLQNKGQYNQGYISFDINNYNIEMVQSNVNENVSIMDDESILMVVDGNIYNSKSIEAVLNYKIKKHSCEVLMPLYRTYGKQMFKYLNGQYAFIIVDKKTKKVMVGRDFIGICPLYIGYNNISDGICIFSEIKCLKAYSNVLNFKPKSYMEIDLNALEMSIEHEMYKKQNYMTLHYVLYDNDYLRLLLEESVKSMIPVGSNHGFILSGSVDSSIIALIASNYGKKIINTFSVGLEHSMDLRYARDMAKYLNSNDIEVIYTVNDCIKVIPNIIYNIESYNVKKIKESFSMYFLTNRISKNINVLLSSDGCDDIFAGHSYYKNAPNPLLLQKDSVYKTFNLYKFINNKSALMNGIECRYPFLEKNIVDYVLSIDPILKLHNAKIDKYLLRRMFQDDLPSEIVWKTTKCNDIYLMSDFKKYSEQYVNNHMHEYQEELSRSEGKRIFPIRSCDNYEEKHYKMIYHKLFNNTGIDLFDEFVPNWV